VNISEKEAVEILQNKGYGIIPPEQFRTDIGEDFREIWSKVSDYTMTSAERGYALYNAVKYIITNEIEGDFTECGVWKGGSCMLMALTLQALGADDRKIFLYDTFQGMTEPGEHDFIAWNGKSVKDKWDEDLRGEKNNFTGWAVDLEGVRRYVLAAGYPEKNLVFVKGPVEETLHRVVPEKISLLRLDTDWYESTKTELECLYPRLADRGVLILDDYGHFTGARKAVDEYFKGNVPPVLLNRIDYTGRIAVKTRKG
jgi:hypothetical protein